MALNRIIRYYISTDVNTQYSGVQLANRQKNQLDKIMTDNSFQEEPLEHLWQMLRVVNLTIRPYYERVQKPYDLPLPQYWILRCLRERPNSTAQDISDFHGMPSMTVSRGVGQLVKKELVERQPDSLDKRRVRLNLTEKGSELIEFLYELSLERDAFVFGGLSQKERLALNKTLKKITGRIRASTWEWDKNGNKVHVLVPENFEPESVSLNGVLNDEDDDDLTENMAELEALRAENHQLKLIIADLTLKNHTLSQQS